MRIIILITILLSIFIKSQIAFSVEYEADYELSYKLKNIPNAQTYETTFALLINDNGSYFKNINKYVKDSLVYYKKLKTSGDILKDVSTFSKYSTDFPENIGMTTSKLYVTRELAKQDYKYEEDNNTVWTLTSDFKKIGNYYCQKATTKKYGRNWIAYFSKEIPFPYGPYKFGNLPGLIIEIYDSAKDYHFTMYKFKKRKFVSKSASMHQNAKLVNKSKLFNARKNELENTSRFNNIIDDPDMLKKLKLKSMEMSKTYNPLELEIY